MFVKNYSVYLFLAGLCISIWLIKILLLGFNTLPSGDNLTYASIARNILENSSIAHISALPSDLYFLGEFPKHDTNQNIGLSIFLVPFFFIFGANNFSIAFSSLVLYVINTFLVYIVSSKLFDKKIALISSFLFVFSSAYYQYISSGLTEPLLILIMLLIAYIQFFKTDNYKGLFIGFLLYALFLTKSGLAVFIFPYFLLHWVFFENGNLKYIFGIVIAFLILSIPLSFRIASIDINSVSAKSDLIDLIFNTTEDKSAWYFGLRSLKFPIDWLEPSRYLFENYIFYIKKYFSTLYSIYLKMHGANFLFAGSILFYGYLLSSTENKLETIFKFFTLTILSLITLGFSLGWAIERYLLPALPFIIIAIASYSAPKITIGKKSYTVILLLILMHTPWLGFIMRDVYLYDDKINYSKLGNFVAEHTNYSDIILSNTPGLVGWYSNRKSVLYPNKLDDVKTLYNINQNINTIVLTSEIKNLFRSDTHQEHWDEIYENNSQNIGSYFCLEDKYINEKNSYKVLLYKICDK